MIAAAPARRREVNGASLDRYAVKIVPIDSVTPSPENEDIYGPIEHDESMDNLIDSIRRKGLAEPIQTTADRERFILSGHRRYYAACQLGWKECLSRSTPASAEKAIRSITGS